MSVLKKLRCPFTRDYPDSVILDIIFTPGEQRLRIFQWLLSLFDPKLRDIFSKPQRQEALVPKLSTALSWLGLCRPEDHELIKGTTQFSKQIAFLEELTELVLLVTTLEDPFANTNMLFDQTEKSCYFVDAWCLREDFSELFAQQVSLFPPDVVKACGLTTKHNTSLNATLSTSGQLDRTSHHQPLPSLQQLTKQSELATKQLEAAQEKLANLLEMQPPGGINHDALPSQQKSLAMNLSTLSQVMGSFSHVYNEEIRPWTNKEPPVFSGFGPTFKKLHSHMEKITEGLKRLDEAHKVFDEMKGMEPLRLKEVTEADPHYTELLSMLDEFLGSRPVQ